MSLSTFFPLDQTLQVLKVFLTQLRRETKKSIARKILQTPKLLVERRGKVPSQFVVLFLLFTLMLSNEKVISEGDKIFKSEPESLLFQI